MNGVESASIAQPSDGSVLVRGKPSAGALAGLEAAGKQSEFNVPISFDGGTIYICKDALPGAIKSLEVLPADTTLSVRVHGAGQQRSGGTITVKDLLAQLNQALAELKKAQ